MAKKDEAKTTSRRDFLKLAAATAPAAVAVAAAGTAEAGTADAGANASGLGDTEHTRAYYEAARF